MGDLIVNYPIRCPVCGSEKLAELRADDVSAALLHKRPLSLYSACHDHHWVASDDELKNIRQFSSDEELPLID